MRHLPEQVAQVLDLHLFDSLFNSKGNESLCDAGIHMVVTLNTTQVRKVILP